MNNLKIRKAEDGVVIQLAVKPKSKRNAIEGIHDGALKLAVTAAPEKGKANAAVVALLSSLLDIPKRDIQLIAGDKSRKKAVLIKGMGPEGLREILGNIGIG